MCSVGICRRHSAQVVGITGTSNAAGDKYAASGHAVVGGFAECHSAYTDTD